MLKNNRLAVTTKDEVWSLVSKYSSLRKVYMEKANRLNLKDIQDIISIGFLKRLAHQKDSIKVLEVGGDQSRVIEYFINNHENVECSIVDRFDVSIGNGTTEKPVFKKEVKIYEALMGDGTQCIPSDYFDFVFSVSVVEHVPEDALEGFFDDCQRVLKPGGASLHNIDIHLATKPSSNPRYVKYEDYFRKTSDLKSGWKRSFDTKFATNPDNVMFRWGERFPETYRRRAGEQACNLMMYVVKD